MDNVFLSLVCGKYSMKLNRIGLLCGMSCYSTKIYYDYMNQYVSDRFGEHYQAKILMNSLNSAEVLSLIKDNKLSQLRKHLINECEVLEKAGVDYIAMTCNTVHYFFDDLKKNSSITLVSILEVTREKVLSLGVKSIGIIGTKFTIEKQLYQNIFNDTDVRVFIPDDLDLQRINKVISNLCIGQTNKNDKIVLQKIAKSMILKGAEAIVLGCTELGLLITEKSILGARVLDSSLIHADKLSELSLKGNISTNVSDVSSTTNV